MEPTDENLRAWEDAHRRPAPEPVRAPAVRAAHARRPEGASASSLLCGAGEATAVLAELGAVATGVDARPAALEAARERWPKILWVDGDPQSLPRQLRRGRFDLVYSGEGVLGGLDDLDGWAPGSRRRWRARRASRLRRPPRRGLRRRAAPLAQRLLPRPGRSRPAVADGPGRERAGARRTARRGARGVSGRHRRAAATTAASRRRSCSTRAALPRSPSFSKASSSSASVIVSGGVAWINEPSRPAGTTRTPRSSASSALPSRARRSPRPRHPARSKRSPASAPARGASAPPRARREPPRTRAGSRRACGCRRPPGPSRQTSSSPRGRRARPRAAPAAERLADAEHVRDLLAGPHLADPAQPRVDRVDDEQRSGLVAALGATSRGTRPAAPASPPSPAPARRSRSRRPRAAGRDPRRTRRRCTGPGSHGANGSRNRSKPVAASASSPVPW